MKNTEDDLIQHACATGWRTHKDIERTASRASLMLHLIGGTAPELGGRDRASRLDVVAQRLEEGGMSGATVNRYVAALLSAWRIGWKSGITAIEPPSFAWRKEGPGRDRIPTRDEVAMMLEEFRRGDYPGVVPNLARFLYRTGCRLGEALAARAIDVTVAPPLPTTVRLGTSKSGRPRTIVVPKAYGWVDRHIWGHQSREHLFNVAPSTFSAYWRRARLACGIGDWFVPHSLRHARATEMVRKGVPLPVVARALGHESIKTTMRYTHPDDADVLEALER